ncbi:hypothetical protein ASB57_18465 [Bordetella sp. N]|nr:hypothetical protein ASB57_18465 [Bordetella sp. N]
MAISNITAFTPDYQLQISADGDSGILPTTIYFLKEFTVTATPALLQDPGSISFDATVTRMAVDETIPSTVKLNWSASNTALFNSVTDTGDGATKKFSHNSIVFDKNAIDDNREAPLTVAVQATTANQVGGPQRSASAQIGYLDAPLYMPGVQTGKNIIDDDTMRAGSIPWAIPPIRSTSPDQTHVTLYASLTEVPDADALKQSDVMVLNPYSLVPDPTKYTYYDTPTDNNAYAHNHKTLNVFYSVVDTRISPLVAGLSRTAQVLVDRASLPDSPVDGRLAPLALSQYTYGVADEALKTTLVATLYLTGDRAPNASDIITIYLHLVGYTSQNLGQTKTIALAPYQLTATDIANGTPIPFPSVPLKTDGFTYDKLSNIEGSNGSVYYTVQAASDGQITQSEARSVVIATVPPHSGEPDAIENLKWALAHMESRHDRRS